MKTVLAADIGGTNLRLALANEQGEILARHRAETAGIKDAKIVVDMIREGAEKLFAETKTPRASLVAVAAGAPGLTNAETGVVIATSYLMGWRDVPLAALLTAALGVPAAADNDVNLAALGESWRGASAGARDLVFLAIGTGVGAGIVLNGKLFQGLGWSAGEIGYMLVPGVDAEPIEKGKPGPLEDMVGGEGIRGQWKKMWSAEKTSLPQEMNATAIFDAAATDALAKSVLDQSARILAFAILNVTLVLDTPHVLLGGGVGLHPALLEATQRVLDERTRRTKPKLVASTLGGDAQLLGAIRLALDTAKLA